MDTVHQFKKSEILQSQVDEEVEYILDYLKSKKQTIEELFETIF